MSKLSVKVSSKVPATLLLDNHFAQVTGTKLGDANVLDALDGIKISHARCEAMVSLYGGQVLSFKPTGHKNVLWLSEQAHYQQGKAIRGGIPLCWPWFGPYDEEWGKVKSVNHGFARQMIWQLESIEADECGVTLVLVLSGEKQHRLWPTAYQLRQTLFFGKSLKQTLEMTNCSENDVQYSAALHSYFSVSDVRNVSIDTLTGVQYYDQLTRESSIQHQAVSCIGEIDRQYHSGEKMTLVDRTWQRQIDIISGNCQQWVLWNPGAELASAMEDVHPNGEKEYVCLEAANTTWQRLPAGETINICQEIIVSHL